MSVRAHLREMHSYSLAESVKWALPEMERIHEQEHLEADCGHDVNDKGDR